MSQQSSVHASVVVLALDLSFGHQQQQVLLGGLVNDGIKGLLQHLLVKNQDCQDVCIEPAAMLAGQFVNVKR